MTTKPQIVVVDYHKGNLSSVLRGLMRAGACAQTSDDPACIREAGAVVLPGVGSFFDAITFMHESGQDKAVLHAIAHGAAFLGICLGLQLLFECGDEGVPADDSVTVSASRSSCGASLAPGDVFEAEGVRWVRGLGVMRGSSIKLRGSRLKVPHVGWDQVHLTSDGLASPLLRSFPEGANMYFTHSYAIADDIQEECVLARTHYTCSFPCVVGRGRIFGCQFHPEKSSVRGLDILRNFVSLAAEAQVERDGNVPEVVA